MSRRGDLPFRCFQTLAAGLAAGAIGTAGCAHSQPATAPASTRPIAATSVQAPDTLPATQADGVPFIYAHWGNAVLPTLPPSEMKRILKAARSVAPADKKIWFVIVREDWPGGWRQWFTAAEVYFEPDWSSPRLRKGHWVRVWTTDLQWPANPEHYVQVAPKASPFGKELTVPDTHWLPIPKVEGVVDDEIVALVDAAESAVNDPSRRLAEREVTEPLESLVRQEKEYSVHVGWTFDSHEFYVFTKSKQGFEWAGCGLEYH